MLSTPKLLLLPTLLAWCSLFAPLSAAACPPNATCNFLNVAGGQHWTQPIATSAAATVLYATSGSANVEYDLPASIQRVSSLQLITSNGAQMKVVLRNSAQRLFTLILAWLCRVVSG